jgi:hypothetical protein
MIKHLPKHVNINNNKTYKSILGGFMSVREFVKILLAKECMTLTQLAKLATENSEKKYTMDGLSHKMRKGSLDFNDVEFFANLLGYEISLKKIEK